MAALHTINGKAFEYACLESIARHCGDIVNNSPLATAARAYNMVDAQHRADLDKAADAATRLLIPLEPMLLGGDERLLLWLAADSFAIGSDGDVRDVLCKRGNWSLGLSCKHNHAALRHPRITESCDFGTDWMGKPCSKEFIDRVRRVTGTLTGFCWSGTRNKFDRYYVPLLTAHLDEIRRMCDEDGSAPGRLLSYFFGSHDFYKVIMNSRARTTTIEAFNMRGTLGQPCHGVRPVTRMPVTKMPTRLLDARFKDNSKTTIILTFDGGWAVSMRLHNKDEIARPTSLAWDVKLAGLPPTMYVNTHSWDES